MFKKSKEPKPAKLKEALDLLRPDIEAAKQKSRTQLWGYGKLVRKLEGYLLEGETVDYLTDGQYGGGKGLMALTDQRVVFVREDFAKDQSEAFRYGDVTHVSWSSSGFGGLKVVAKGGQASIKQVHIHEGPTLARIIEERMPKTQASASPVAPETDVAPDLVAADPLDQIARLGELHAAGVLTDAEFAAKKGELLERL